MSVDNFIPKLWQAKIQDQISKGSILTGIVNRDFEGQLSYGNKLQVTDLQPVTVKNLASRTDNVTYDDITTTATEFVIDQMFYSAVKVNNIDQVQVAGKDLMGKISTSMANAILEKHESFLHAELLSSGTTFQPDGRAGAATGGDLFKVILGLRKALNKAQAPTAGRVLLVNPEAEEMLFTTSVAGASNPDFNLTRVDATGTTDGLRECLIGRLAGFDVITTPYFPESTHPTLAGLAPKAVSFAQQIEKTDAFTSHDSFSDLLRSLTVFGGKVMKPKHVQVVKFDG